MELNDLKSAWKNAGDDSKSEADLQRMAAIKNHPSLKAIQRKLIIETTFVLLLLAFYYNMFDGDQKPFVANVLLTGSLVLYMVNNVTGYLSLQKIPIGANIRQSLHGYLLKIKRLATLSLVISFLYGCTFVMFFAIVVDFTIQKYFILGGIIGTLILSIYLSQKLWKERISRVRSHLEYFGQG